MKSITPVISIILLILITIFASGAAFFFVQNMDSIIFSQAGRQASETSSYCSRIRLLTMDSDKITVQNNGCGTIDSVVVLINGEPTSFNLNYPLAEGEVGEILVTNLGIGSYEVKIMLDNGLYEEITFNAVSESSNFVYIYPISSFAGQSNLKVGINEPNSTYIRLPSNANINSLSLTIDTPKVFSANSLDFQIDFLTIMGMGYDEAGNTLFLVYDINDSTSAVSANLSIYAQGENEVSLSGQYNFLNLSVNPSYGKSQITYRNGFIHGVIQNNSTELFYFNYSVLTHVLANSSIAVLDYDILNLQVDNDNNKYLFYTNSTSNAKYLYSSTSKNGGFFDLSVNSSMLNLPILVDANEYTFYFDSTAEIFHAVASRKYNITEGDQDSYKDIVYVKSTDGIAWSAPESILGMYGFEYSSHAEKYSGIPYSNFYLTSNPSGDLLFIHGENLLGGTDSYLYKKLSGGSWQKIKEIHDCFNPFLSNIAVNNNKNNIKYFCIPVKKILSFEEYNVYYESNDFGSSWTGPFMGFYAMTEGEIPASFFGRINNNGNLIGTTLDMNMESAIDALFSAMPGGIGYRVEGNPGISLKVGDSFALANYSLSSRSYSVNIKEYADSYLESCSHSCDIPIYFDSNSSMNISLSVSGSYTLGDFQMYALSSGVAKQEYSSMDSSQELYFNVMKNQSISGASVILDFKGSGLITKNMDIGINSDEITFVKGIPIYGNKDLLIISSVSIPRQDFFDLKISRSTDLGETWSAPETVISNCSYLSAVTIAYNAMDLKGDYLHGFANRTLYFNYSLSAKALLTQNFSEVFAQAVYSSKLGNNLYIFYINLTDDDLYFAKNNDYANAVKINDSLSVVYSTAYDYYIPIGSIVENEAGIHILIPGIDGSDAVLYYLNSSNGGASWKTQQVPASGISGSFLPLTFLANGSNIFISWGSISSSTYSYIRYISGAWSSVTTVSGSTYFTASNNGSTIYAGLNIPVSLFPKNVCGFITRSYDFGATWTTPACDFKNYNSTTMAGLPKFFFDMPYVYGFYYNYKYLPTRPVITLVKFVEAKSISPKLLIDSNIAWQASGAQSGLVNISGLASSINAYSNSCQNQSCTIPFSFSSSTNNNFGLFYLGLTTNSTKCSELNPCSDNNVCTYDNCIGDSCQFMPVPEGNVTGCNLAAGCFNEFHGNYGVNCRCLNGRCRDSCGDDECQAWESVDSCAEDCLGFFPGQIIQLDTMNGYTGDNAIQGMCVADFTGDGEPEIVLVKRGYSSYNITVYSYNGSTILFDKQTQVSHSGEMYPAKIKCGNLSSPAGLKVVVAGSIASPSTHGEFVFIDVVNITAGSINVENSSEFKIFDQYNYIYSLGIGDLDGVAGNEIYAYVHGYSGALIDRLYKYNYTNNQLILDSIVWAGAGVFLSDIFIADLNDSNPLNELIIPSDSNNKLAFYSYKDGSMQLDSNNYVTSIWDLKLPMYVADVNNDLKDEIIVFYSSAVNPKRANLRVYSINSGALTILDEEEIIIDSTNTQAVNVIVGEFDSTPGKEIVLFMLKGGCPGGLTSYFRIYNFTSGSLNFENQRQINDYNGMKFGNIFTFIYNTFDSYDINDDGVLELLLSGFLIENSCDWIGAYQNSLVLFEYRE